MGKQRGPPPVEIVFSLCSCFFPWAQLGVGEREPRGNRHGFAEDDYIDGDRILVM